MALDCYWVGSLDFNFLVEIKLGFPLNPPKSEKLFAGGSLQQPRVKQRTSPWQAGTFKGVYDLVEMKSYIWTGEEPFAKTCGERRSKSGRNAYVYKYMYFSGKQHNHKKQANSKEKQKCDNCVLIFAPTGGLMSLRVSGCQSQKMESAVSLSPPDLGAWPLGKELHLLFEVPLGGFGSGGWRWFFFRPIHFLSR